jgi:hypothetical protein
MFCTLPDNTNQSRLTMCHLWPIVNEYEMRADASFLVRVPPRNRVTATIAELETLGAVRFGGRTGSGTRTNA